MSPVALALDLARDVFLALLPTVGALAVAVPGIYWLRRKGWL